MKTSIKHLAILFIMLSVLLVTVQESESQVGTGSPMLTFENTSSFTIVVGNTIHLPQAQWSTPFAEWNKNADSGFYGSEDLNELALDINPTNPIDEDVYFFTFLFHLSDGATTEMYKFEHTINGYELYKNDILIDRQTTTINELRDSTRIERNGDKFIVTSESRLGNALYTDIETYPIVYMYIKNGDSGSNTPYTRRALDVTYSTNMIRPYFIANLDRGILSTTTYPLQVDYSFYSTTTAVRITVIGEISGLPYSEVNVTSFSIPGRFDARVLPSVHVGFPKKLFLVSIDNYGMDANDTLKVYAYLYEGNVGSENLTDVISMDWVDPIGVNAPNPENFTYLNQTWTNLTELYESFSWNNSTWLNDTWNNMTWANTTHFWSNYTDYNMTFDNITNFNEYNEYISDNPNSYLTYEQFLELQNDSGFPLLDSLNIGIGVLGIVVSVIAVIVGIYLFSRNRRKRSGK